MVQIHNSLCFFFFFFLHLILTQVASFTQPLQPPSSPQDAALLFEDKTRLGSKPPSCHNRCNSCHPCMAIQVPTLPSHDRVSAALIRPPPGLTFDTSPVTGVNQYSNYKPMGWKCHCNGHFYNP